MNRHSWQRHVWHNRLQTGLILAFMLGFLALIGYIVWGGAGLLQLLLLGLLIALINPVASPRLVLRLYGAQALRASDAPRLFETLSTLAQHAELPAMPSVYYIPSQIINAFSVGSRHEPAIALSDGMLRSMNLREIQAVLAHEVSHIRNNDLWVMGLADLISRLTNWLSLIGQFLLVASLPMFIWSEARFSWLAIALLVFAPHLALAAQFGLSRTREFNADMNAAWLTGDPQAMAQALIKIEQQKNIIFENLLLPGWKVPEPSWLRTHPPIEQRVQRLMQLRTITQEPAYPDETAADDFGRPSRARRPRYHIGGVWY